MSTKTPKSHGAVDQIRPWSYKWATISYRLLIVWKAASGGAESCMTVVRLYDASVVMKTLPQYLIQNFDSVSRAS